MKSLLVCIFLLIPTLCFGAVAFDNVDDTINLGDVAYADNLTAYTIYMVIKFNSVASGDRIFDKWQATNNRQILFQIGGTGGDEWQAWYRHPTLSNWSCHNTDSFNIATGVWYKVAVSWTAHATWLFYINGTSYSHSSCSASGSASNTSTSATVAYIGNPPTNGGTELDATISEFAFWSTASTDAELSMLTSAQVKRFPLQMRPASLQSYLAFDQVANGVNPDNQVYFDFSGKGNTGTADDDTNVAMVSLGEGYLSYP